LRAINEAIGRLLKRPDIAASPCPNPPARAAGAEERCLCADLWMDFCSQWLGVSSFQLGHNSPAPDEHALNDSLEDALRNFLVHPAHYHADCGLTVAGYLRMVARGAFANRRRSQSRRRKREKTLGVYPQEFENIFGNDGGNKPSTGQYDIGEVLEQFRKTLPAADLPAFDLLRAGAPQEDWVRHLQLEGRPEEEQRRRINREQERLKRKLRRRAQSDSSAFWL